jgi:hypothetical protein
LAQVHLAQDNDVVHTFTPDRSDQPFGKAILPRRGWCGRLVTDAHGAQSACDAAAIDPVAIADEVVRGLIPRKRLRDLTCNELWQQAGEPVGRDEEFYHQAEQELRNEDKSSPLRTPDTL